MKNSSLLFREFKCQNLSHMFAKLSSSQQNWVHCYSHVDSLINCFDWKQITARQSRYSCGINYFYLSILVPTVWTDPLIFFLNCKTWNIEMSNSDFLSFPQRGSGCSHNIILRFQVHGSLQHHPVPQCHPTLLCKYYALPLPHPHSLLHTLPFQSYWRNQRLIKQNNWSYFILAGDLQTLIWFTNEIQKYRRSVTSKDVRSK